MTHNKDPESLESQPDAIDYLPRLFSTRPQCSADLERQDSGEFDKKSYASSASELEESEVKLVSWDGEDSHKNPRSWSRRHRMFLVFLVSCYTILSPISSTSNVPALDVLSREFHVSSYVMQQMMMSAPMLAFVIAPSFYAPLSEQFGRKLIQVTNIM